MTATQTVHRLTRTDLASMSDTDLTRSYVAINEVIAAWDEKNTVRPSHLRFTFANVLHEMIARRILTEHPTAAALTICSDDVSHCTDHDGEVADWCTGHPIGMHASVILDAHGRMLGTVDPYSPVQYWLERISVDAMHTAYFLDVRTREIHRREDI